MSILQFFACFKPPYKSCFGLQDGPPTSLSGKFATENVDLCQILIIFEGKIGPQNPMASLPKILGCRVAVTGGLVKYIGADQPVRLPQHPSGTVISTEI